MQDPGAPRIERGDINDYRAMARWHYRAGPPATRVLILRAMARERRIGVLVVSMPTLNGRWRAPAWPEIDWSRGGPRAAAARLNRRVRTISRVIVDPRYRGTGVACALVRAYLASPLSSHTESIAAMGEISPFFQRAGMRAVPLAPVARDDRLRQQLRRLGVPPWRLVEIESAQRLVARQDVLSPLERWASGSRATRGLEAQPIALAVRAASALCAPRSVFVFP